jgi:Protein of unknown function with HXXEE motif
MSEELRSILIGTAGLSFGGVVAGVLTVVRGRAHGSAVELQAALRLAAVALLAQAVHFVEELGTGFHQRFPELLGLAPWSNRFFVSFNLFWLAVWALSLWGLANRRRAALFPLWFLAIAGVANGVAHPLLSLRVAGYFPGLVTSPLIGLAGWLLLGRLLRVTGASPRRPGALPTIAAQ